MRQRIPLYRLRRMNKLRPILFEWAMDPYDRADRLEQIAFRERVAAAKVLERWQQ